jgi:hypothetical protein
MNYYRWSSLFRGYDTTLRYNQLILALSAAGAIAGFFIGGQELWPRLVAAAVAGGIIFMAGALAKELVPHRPWAAVLAAVLTLPFVTAFTFNGAVALFWLIGGTRFLNRSTGLRPKATDLLALLAVSTWLGWQVTPLFGILISMMLILDSLLPDGQRLHAPIGLVALLTTGVWLMLSDLTAVSPDLWAVVGLLTITIGFIPVVLGAYRSTAVGDASGKRLNPLRVQAGQVFALSAGLFIASWRSESGILLLIGLWAALAASLIYYLLSTRMQRSTATS